MPTDALRAAERACAEAITTGEVTTAIATPPHGRLLRARIRLDDRHQRWYDESPPTIVCTLAVAAAIRAEGEA